ncbi:LysR family transcriptional regulator [Comamonas piscis]|uniref:LysR family transcriptional regulator n=1 Tax=Comamonas piscis TaxID=1562974 RepID=A0A7G5EFW3_9BURK|nr:LysR substrate-binding domain-containing protein [Comamonas piscis]QMV72888.1 LysR family transcriptional regulator [Comamonas piscis]WSO35666.1 LysR substrate-binding domain-containing protein [Comamonas piscis]
MDNLNHIAAFVQAAERSSFVAAARALGISASAVGKSVAKLEAQLGTQLLVRTTRRVSLSHEGELMYTHWRRILDDLQDAQALLSSTQSSPRGLLRIGLPTIGYRFLLPVIPAFRARYPDIELDLDFNDRLVDVVEARLDAVIRSGVLADSSLSARRLGLFRFVLCASPAYLAQRGRPQRPEDLATHDCLRFRFPTSGKLQPWQMSGSTAEVQQDAAAHPAALTCNNMEALRGAAIGGLGIAYMPDFLARDALADGSLQTVLDDFLSHTGQFSILWPSGRLMSPRLRVFVDFVAERLFQPPPP